MSYIIVFHGGRGTPTQYLVTRGDNYTVGEKEAAERFADNQQAIDAALTMTKTIAMMGLKTKPFSVTYEKPKTEGKK